jgi:hypothetical protein
MPIHINNISRTLPRNIWKSIFSHFMGSFPNGNFSPPILYKGPEDIHHVLTCPKCKSLSRSCFIQDMHIPLKVDESHQALLHQILDSIAYQKNYITMNNDFVHKSQIGWDMVLRGLLPNEK